MVIVKNALVFCSFKIDQVVLAVLLKDKFEIKIPNKITPKLIKGIKPIFSPIPNPHIIATNGNKYVVNEPKSALDFFTSLLNNTIAMAEPTTPNIVRYPKEANPFGISVSLYTKSVKPNR